MTMNLKMPKDLIATAIAALMMVAEAPVLQAQQVVKSHPKAGAALSRPLKAIRIWFDKVPDMKTFTIAISGGKSPLKITGLHAMSENDVMGFVEGQMPDGAYSIDWRSVTLSSSSKASTKTQIKNVHKGSIPFTVKRHEGYVEDKWTPPLDIGVLLYDRVEPIDVFGPVEMWMNMGPAKVRVHFIGKTRDEVALTTTSYPAKLAPKMKPQYDFATAPELDLLMVPGGIGTFKTVDDLETLKFIQTTAKKGAVLSSVCTGSAILAKAGVLKGRKATTNKAFFDYAKEQGPAEWQTNARWVEDGKVITSSGVTAGIDMSLAVLARYFGSEVARMIAQSTEYSWNPDPNNDPFTPSLNQAMPYIDYFKNSH